MIDGCELYSGAPIAIRDENADDLVAPPQVLESHEESTAHRRYTRSATHEQARGPIGPRRRLSPVPRHPRAAHQKPGPRRQAPGLL